MSGKAECMVATPAVGCLPKDVGCMRLQRALQLGETWDIGYEGLQIRGQI
eukprot:CAMPEP_0115835016 /NCGR_PEP_ID=MMETSP0287-20121206/3981_1 /TAXON_ID=412157 /ORGANISM="Chrysochromulina rotalis, Strain UIO044" /LENGTH=49 /DNA_ID=CAMNT_0003288469 /DNA_START=405 /DNA_END=554 /DNA_ORIENTATION=+